ncbi:uncharacterized protein BP01DRAFT_217971 [Aspergillus saccharolyticus JOP 1030-1]|uniref:Uncharacterized protein n=1 Tax=Aspergillus saccharolyticus JOP 1030-1 TaxID=1450539 RepID=A0A319ALS9_9EURO|nr:hypothetical protein BP01DRAFT_217971 [Aspergillus saccharolyticus JOP 1030-1]PYH47532.1 hypothetical protein BP01DRAFT_217971 [Aspergillus saccharolyticus JOP 1030-1]
MHAVSIRLFWHFLARPVVCPPASRVSSCQHVPANAFPSRYHQHPPPSSTPPRDPHLLVALVPSCLSGGCPPLPSYSLSDSGLHSVSWLLVVSTDGDTGPTTTWHYVGAPSYHRPIPCVHCATVYGLRYTSDRSSTSYSKPQTSRKSETLRSCPVIIIDDGAHRVALAGFLPTFNSRVMDEWSRSSQGLSLTPEIRRPPWLGPMTTVDSTSWLQGPFHPALP